MNIMQFKMKLSICLASVLVFTSLSAPLGSITALADTTKPAGTVTGLTNPPTISGSSDISISKTLSATSAADQYKVTFSLPQTADVTEKTIDVVFCMDKSSVADITGLQTAAKNLLDSMSAVIAADPNVHFNVGVVVYSFEINSISTGGLLDLATQETAIKNAINNGSGAGTSIHTGLLEAERYLDADTTTPNDMKFIINISDFAGYGTGIYGDPIGFFRHFGPDTYTGPEDFKRKYGFTPKTGMPYPTDFTSWGSATEGGPVADKQAGIDAVDALINNKTLFSGYTADSTGITGIETVGPDASEFHMSTAGYGTIMTAAQMDAMTTPTMMEKSIYLFGDLLKKLDASGINLLTVGLDYSHDNLNRSALSKAFQYWIAQEFGEENYFSVSDNKGQPNYLTDSFSNITSKILNTLGKGTLTDTIGSYFTLHDYADIEIALNGVPLAKTQLTGSDDKNADASWGFGTADGSGAYPYELRYTAATQTFEWVLNNEVKNTQQLSFSYLIDLDKEKIGALKYGTYHLQSNASASIDYQDVTYEDGNPTYGPSKHVSFNSPYATYEVGQTVYADEFTLKKVWRGVSANSQEDVQIQVYVDGVATGAPYVLGKSNNWTADVKLSTVSDATPSIATMADAMDEDGTLTDGVISDDISALGATSDDISGDVGQITLAELNVPAGFNVSYVYNSDNETFTVTNTKPSSSSSSSGGNGGTTPGKTVTTTPSLNPVSKGYGSSDSLLNLYGLNPDGTPRGNISMGGRALPKTGEAASKSAMMLAILTGFLALIACAYMTLRQSHNS